MLSCCDRTHHHTTLGIASVIVTDGELAIAPPTIVQAQDFLAGLD
ncbi:MAG: hypothetical protein QNJ46_33800 [Leptolyngbyaceae cyanobacterium MO_188.B28]|nr:hypothetical protein [Leptolyngbyaceae cyanobacterium MO_188.B28]